MGGPGPRPRPAAAATPARAAAQRRVLAARRRAAALHGTSGWPWPAVPLADCVYMPIFQFEVPMAIRKRAVKSYYYGGRLGAREPHCEQEPTARPRGTRVRASLRLGAQLVSSVSQLGQFEWRHIMMHGGSCTVCAAARAGVAATRGSRRDTTTASGISRARAAARGGRPGRGMH